jgi:feruloyl esterase
LLGRPGANVFDMLTPLVQWMEDDIAPEHVIATHFGNNNPAQGVQFTRPLCPYPKEAEYKGGNTNHAANFVGTESRIEWARLDRLQSPAR